MLSRYFKTAVDGRMPEVEFMAWFGHYLRENKIDLVEYAELVGEEPHIIDQVMRGTAKPTKRILADLGLTEIKKEEYVRKVEWVPEWKTYYEELK